MFLTFAVTRLNFKPNEFWGLTFGEFWPLYNQVMGNYVRPLSRGEFEDLENAWMKGSANGKT